MWRPSGGSGRVRRGLRLLADSRVIGWPLFWVSCLALAVAELPIVAGTSIDDRSVGWPTALAQVTLAQLATFAVLLLARHTYLGRPAAARHPGWTVGSFVIASWAGFLAAGLAVQAATGSAEGPDGASLLNHMLYEAAVLVVAGIVIASLLQHRNAVAELSAQRASLLATERAAQRALSVERSAVAGRASAMLQQVLDSLDPGDPAGSARLLRTAASDIVRPLSHELAATTPEFAPTLEPLPRPRWRAVLAEVVSVPLLAPKAMAATVTLLAATLTVTSTPVPEAVPSSAGVRAGDAGVSVSLDRLATAVLQLAAVFCATWAAAWLVARFSQRHMSGDVAWRRWAIALIGIVAVAVLAQVAIIAVAMAGSPTQSAPTGLGVWLVLAIPLAMVATGVAVWRTVAIRRAAVLADIEQANATLAWEAAKARESLWNDRRELAHLLHGPAQAALNAGAIQLASDPTSAHAVVGEVRAQLRQAMAQLSTPSHRTVDVPAALDVVCRTWSGICEVRGGLDDTARERLEHDPACAALLVHIVREAAANAAIHGGAHHVDLVVRLADDRLLLVEVADDGEVVSAAGAPGLGSRLLDEVAVEWHLERGAGTRLTVLLPLASAVPAT